MPYYNAGDYYGRGDYYQAGGIFGFLGGVFKKAVGLIPGVGPVLQAAAGIRSALQHHGVPLPAPYVPGPAGMVPGVGSALEQGFAGLAPGGGGVPMIAPPAGVITTSPLGTPVHPAAIAMQLARMRHTHPNKSTYVSRGGGTSRWPPGLLVHPAHTEMVTSRRMNVANPRALRRALRRAAGFVKLARRAHVKLTQFHGGGRKKKKK